MVWLRALFSCYLVTRSVLMRAPNREYTPLGHFQTSNCLEITYERCLDAYQSDWANLTSANTVCAYFLISRIYNFSGYPPMLQNFPVEQGKTIVDLSPKGCPAPWRSKTVAAGPH